VSLPSLATLTQLESRYDSSVDNPGRAQALLDDASALVREVAGSDYVDVDNALTGVPQRIISIVCEVTRRAYENPRGLQGETLGDYTWRAGYTGTKGSAAMGVYLTSAEQSAVRRAAGKFGASSVSLTKLMPYVPTSAVDED